MSDNFFGIKLETVKSTLLRFQGFSHFHEIDGNIVVNVIMKVIIIFMEGHFDAHV